MLVAIAALRIVSTYTVLAHTVDEPIHLGAGIEWLDHGTITGDASHPPLARVLSAVGPYLAGARWTHTGNSMRDGLDVLGRDARYDRMLALARLGILPFFLFAALMVFLWGNHIGGPVAGLIATFLFTTTPPVLAHAGMVTTDMAATALAAAGAYAGLLWAERPDAQAHGAARAGVGFRNHIEVLAGGLSARDLDRDVRRAVAGDSGHAAARARALAGRARDLRDCVRGDLGGIPFLLWTAGFCACLAARAAVLRWLEHDPRSQTADGGTRQLHSGVSVSITSASGISSPSRWR